MVKVAIPELEGLLYHVTPMGSRELVLSEGINARCESRYGVKWEQRVLFATARLAAYEIVYNFMCERGGEYVFILVGPTRLRADLWEDADYDPGLWTGADVPAEAIIGTEEVDEGFFESDEFLACMGFD